MNETVHEKGTGAELNIQELLVTYLRKWKVIVLCVILAAAITFGITYCCVTPMYRAGISLYVNNTSVVGNKEHLTSADLSASIYLVKGYMTVATSDVVLEKAAGKLDGEYTVGQLREAITVERVEDTVIFNLYVTHSDPEEAARIANVLAEVAPEEIAIVIDGSSASVVDIAKVPSSVYSPSYSRNTLLGAVGGLLLAIIYLTIMHLQDTRVKDENDLTDMFDLPILGRIPDLEKEISGANYSSKSE